MYKNVHLAILSVAQIEQFTRPSSRRDCKFVPKQKNPKAGIVTVGNRPTHFPLQESLIDQPLRDNVDE